MAVLLVAFGATVPFSPAIALDVPFASIVLFRTVKKLNGERPLTTSNVELLTGYKLSKRRDLVLDSGAPQYREISTVEVHLKPDHNFKFALLRIHPGLTVTPEEVEGRFGHPQKIDRHPSAHLPANKNALLYSYDNDKSGISFEFERPKVETPNGQLKLRAVRLY